jgi:hypothetical protein
MFVIPPIEFAENLIKFNWSKIAKGALSIGKRKIELIEAEMTAPGPRSRIRLRNSAKIPTQVASPAIDLNSPSLLPTKLHRRPPANAKPTSQPASMLASVQTRVKILA